MQKQKTIFITGGHFTPAMAVIEEIQNRKLPWRIVFIGRKQALEGSRESSEEYSVVTAAGIEYIPLITGRLPRYSSLVSFFSLWKIPYGFFQVFVMLIRWRPQLILSFGSYVAFPICLLAWIMGVPVVTHEQTAIVGLANKWISKLATKIFVSYPNQYLPKSDSRIIVTGLPIRQGLFQPPRKPSFVVGRDRPILYLTGGSTGADSLNRLFFLLINRLLKSYIVIHQTGRISYRKALALRSTLTVLLQKRYCISSFFNITDLAWIYRNAVLVIGRAGANTVTEVAVLAKPALFIPLPWSANKEQWSNALRLAQRGQAEIVDQDKITTQNLEEEITKIMHYYYNYKTKATKFALEEPLDAAKRIVDECQLII